MKFCSNCGNKLNEGQKFCPNCGNSLEEPKKETKKVEVKEEVKEEEIVETPVEETKISTPVTQPKKDKKTLIIILVSLFLIAAIIVGAIFAVQYFEDNSGSSSTTSSSKSKNKDKEKEEEEEKKTDTDKEDDSSSSSSSNKKPSDDDEKDDTKTVSCSIKEKEDNVDEEVIFDVKFKENEPISGNVDVTFDFSAYSSSEMEKMLGEVTSDQLCSMFTEAFTSSMGIDSDEADEYITSCKSSTSGSKYKLGMDINMSKIYKAAKDKSNITPENLKTALQGQGFSCKIK